MQISGSIPMHIARAYGLPSEGASKRVAPAAPVAAIAPARAIDTPAAEPTSGKVLDLIGGTVRGGIDFTSGSPGGNGSFQLYTRAADKIEAAVGVQLGRAIDVKG